ncbi:MAG: GAF domain-containing protein, partial [Chloroflexi bacterium]
MAEKMIQGNSEKPWHSKVMESITRPSSAISDVGQRRKARLLAGITFFLSITVALGALSSLIVHRSRPEMSSNYSFLFVLALSIASYIFSRTRYFTVGAIIILAAFSLSAQIGPMMDVEDPEGFALTFLGLAFIISSIMLSVRGILVLMLANIALVLAAMLMGASSAYGWTIIGQVIVYGTLLSIFSATRNAIERDRLEETNRTNQKLQVLSTSLEQRVGERTRDLALAAEIGRRISTVRDMDALLSEAVDLIRDRFNLYYAQIYLIDAGSRSLLLRAGTGEMGKELLRRAHSLAVGLTSINGAAIVERRPVIVEDTAQSLIFKPNPLLPETRSEMSIPLVSGDRVFGVLDLQGYHQGDLNQENLAVFETLAGQLATALENSELFARLQGALAEAEAHSRQAARRNWDEYLDGIEVKERIAFDYDLQAVTPLAEPLVETTDPGVLTAPVLVSGEPVGAIQLTSDRPWQPEEWNMVNFVARLVAQQIENLRLLNQAERYRGEAEAAMRRLTRAEWVDYMQAAEHGEFSFVYAQDAVQPVSAADDGKLTFDIRVRDEEIGRFGFTDLEDLSPEDAELVQAVTGQLGAHLENIRLYSTAQRELEERRKAEQLIAKRANELTTVSEVATAVATIQSPGEMLQTVVHLTKVSFGL